MRACAAIPDEREQHRDDRWKQLPFGFHERPHDRAPERLSFVRGQIAVDVGGVVRDFAQWPRPEPVRAQFQVWQQQRHRGARHNGRRRAQRCPHAHVFPEPAVGDLVDDVGGGHRREVHQEVAARPVLEHQGGAGARERPGAARFEVAPEAVQGERHPLRRHHLHVRELADAIGREPVEQAGHEPGPRAPRQLAHEQERAEPRQDRRGQEQQVVAEHDVAGEGVDGEDLQDLRRQVLGVGEREGLGVEDVGVEVAAERAQIAAEEAQPVIGAPLQDPAVEHRVAEVPGDVAAEARCKRPRQDERDQGIEPCGGGRVESGLGARGWGLGTSGASPQSPVPNPPHPHRPRYLAVNPAIVA